MEETVPKPGEETEPETGGALELPNGTKAEANESGIETAAEAGESAIVSEGAAEEPPLAGKAQPLNSEGSRTFTMRELLNEMKDEENGPGGKETSGSNGRDAKGDSTAASSSYRLLFFSFPFAFAAC